MQKLQILLQKSGMTGAVRTNDEAVKFAEKVNMLLKIGGVHKVKIQHPCCNYQRLRVDVYKVMSLDHLEKMLRH